MQKIEKTGIRVILENKFFVPEYFWRGF